MGGYFYNKHSEHSYGPWIACNSYQTFPPPLNVWRARLLYSYVHHYILRMFQLFCVYINDFLVRSFCKSDEGTELNSCENLNFGIVT